MEIREYLLAALANAHFYTGSAMEDLTEEAAHWQPPGATNTIARLLAHAVIAEDLMINRVFKSGEPVFLAGGWATRTGLPEAAGRLRDNEAIWDQEWRLQLDAFNSYRVAVEQSAVDYVASLNSQTLDREYTAGPNTRSVHGALRGIVIHHLLIHNGEISAVKGLQGLKGPPAQAVWVS
jgi:hypothetical protein